MTARRPIDGGLTRRRILGLVAAWLLSGLRPANAARRARPVHLPPLHDPAADWADAADAVMVLLFSLPDCPYCAVVRRNYLMPLARDPANRGRLLFRELMLSSGRALIGFDGQPTTASALAGRLQVGMAPTVLFLDRSGGERAERLVGGDVAGFYGGLLDRALRHALVPRSG